MPAFCISYDLNKPGQNYAPLHDAIKALGLWWHYLDSTWLVSTSLDVGTVSARLRQRIDESDRLLVIPVCRPAGGWLTQAAWDWINSNVPPCR